MATGGTIVIGGTTRTGGVAAVGGSTRSGGTSGTAGSPKTGGTTATGGTTGPATTASTGSPSCNSTLPAYTTSQTVSATINITGVKDYNFQRFCADPNTLGPGDQSESQQPVFMLAKGATLRNVIVGGSGCSAADGIHCESGSCTLENVWIGDVGEDAITFKGSDTSQVMTITGGGAFEASDKVIQHNGPGTIKINGFYVKNAGKLYRSCGNCSNNGFARHVELTNIFASGVKVLAGINANYGDTATVNSLTRCGSVTTICETFTGNSSGAEPPALTSYGPSGGDGKACIYSASAILK
jgi:pectate lyase